MKQVYLAAAALLAGSTFGQQLTDGPTNENVSKIHKVQETPARDQVPAVGSRAIIYSETFSDPFNNGWTRTGSGSSGSTYTPNDCWTLDFDGPNGVFSNPATQIINSTTQNDGFLMMDADFLNGGGGMPQTWETFHVEAVSPVYNLASNPNVTVSFEHRYRICCSPALDQIYFEVSTDGFNNVSLTVPLLYADAGINDDSGTRLHTINITNAISGNPANTQIRFRWGEPGNTNNADTYFWQIDDLTIYDTEDYAGTLDSLAYWADMANFNGAYTNGEDYADGFQKIPASWTATTPLEFGAYLSNVGVQNWTGAALQVDMNGSSWATSPTETVNAGAQSTHLYATATMPSAVGSYTFTSYGVINGTFNVMDTTSLGIEVTDNNYSVAGSTPTGTISIQDWVWNTTPQSGGCGGEFIVTAPAQEEIYGMQARFTDTSYNEFVPIECVVYVNGTAVTNNETFTVDPTYFGGYQDLRFANGPITVNPGDTVTYYIISDYESDPNHSLEFASSGTEAYHLGLVITFDAQGAALSNFLVEPAMVDISVDPALYVEELETGNIASLSQNRPNPFDHNTAINFSLVSNEMVTFTITDVAGKVVKTMDLGSRGAGEHQIQLNAAEFNKGIYFYTLTAGDSRMTKKMIVTK